jgi:uncharacterized protein (DUF924 family)
MRKGAIFTTSSPTSQVILAFWRLIQALCAETGDGEILRFAELHRDIIQKFGRFPHRNAALGRESTPAEMTFLNEGGFAG